MNNELEQKIRLYRQKKSVKKNFDQTIEEKKQKLKNLTS